MASKTKPHVFPEEWKEGVYQAIYNRRDVRAQYKNDPIPEEVLGRILKAAHHAPSVGYMQPWDFIIIRDSEIRKKVKEGFNRANKEAAKMFDESKKGKYRKFKLEGIIESPINICITCDRSRFGPVVIGKTSQPVMDLYSTVCAVQNLWLAARAEGLGVGWVSIISTDELKAILELPENVEPVAYLCVGYVTDFPEKPELESAGWLPRIPISDIIHLDSWKTELSGNWNKLEKVIKEGK